MDESDIGKPEIYDLYIGAIVRDHDVFWLEIAVYDLFTMDIIQSVADFAYDLFCHYFAYLFISDHVFQSPSVYPFHDDAVPDRREIYHSEILAYTAVTEGKTYVEIFPEKFFIERIPSKFFLECLVDEESSVLAATVQFAEPIL